MRENCLERMKMKYLVMAIAVIHGGCALAAMEWNVMVNPAQELRPIKLMNAVNNSHEGSYRSDTVELR